MSGGDFERVLAEAGEDPAGPRPQGWETAALLARMREDLAAHLARVAARRAPNAARRRAALELYQRTREQAGAGPGPVPPWMTEDGPVFRFYGSYPADSRP